MSSVHHSFTLNEVSASESNEVGPAQAANIVVPRQLSPWTNVVIRVLTKIEYTLVKTTANWNPRVSLILGKKQIVITPDRVLQFTMAGSLDVRFAAVGLEVGATGGAKVTYSKGPMGPDKGNQPLVATLPGLYTLPLHRSFPWYLMRGTFQ